MTSYEQLLSPTVDDVGRRTTYGLSIMTGGQGPDRFRRMAKMSGDAEAAGFHAIWTNELYNHSATIGMAVMAGATSRVRVGCNIAYGVGRTPLIWAAEARDLDELSNGRLVLGLGNGTPKMMEDWHGVSGEAPASRMTELVEVLRKLWRLHEAPVHHDGRFYRVHLTPTAPTAPPIQPHLPIWTAGVGPAMVRAAGRCADGLIGHPMYTRSYVEELVRPELAAGAAAVGRDVDDIALMGILICAVDDDEEEARRKLAFAIAQYAASRVYDRLFALHGWTSQQDVIRTAVRARDYAAIVRSVPDDLLDVVGVACTPSQLPARVALHAGDYDHLNVVVPPWGLTPDESQDATEVVLREMRPLLGPVADEPGTSRLEHQGV